jgi:hypothetical protein
VRAILGIGLLLIASVPARAALVTLDEFEPSAFIIGTAGTRAVYSYNAFTNVFSFAAEAANVDSRAVLYSQPYVFPTSLIAEDVFGSFSLAAIVTETGTQGGLATWVGSIESLGIGAGTTLFSASVHSVELQLAAWSGFQILTSIDYVHPVLEGLFGEINSALIACIVCGPGFAFAQAPFSVDVPQNRPSTQNPSIWFSAKQIPEPGTLSMFAVGALLLVLGLRRRLASRV